MDNSTVTLVLYDKDVNGNHKDFAHVVGDFNNWTLSNDEKSQMYRDDASGCWWITLAGLDAGKEYAFQYYVGTKEGEVIHLADAYTEKYWILIMIKIFQLLPIMKTWFILREG